MLFDYNLLYPISSIASLNYYFPLQTFINLESSLLQIFYLVLLIFNSLILICFFKYLIQKVFLHQQ